MSGNIEKIKELVKQREEIDNQIAKLREEVDFTKLDFDIWYEIAEKEHSDWAIQASEAPCTSEFLDECEIRRYSTLTLDDILEKMGEYEVDEETETKIRAELVKINFGSCKWDW